MSVRTLTEAERAYVATCRRFAAEVIAPQVRHWDDANRFPDTVHAEAARWGLAHAGFAVEDGGLGMSHLALAFGGHAMAQVCAPITFTLAFDLGALRPVMVAGTPKQRARWVRGLVSSGGHASWCMTEPHLSGSDVLSVDTRAVRDGDGWVLDGDKCMVGMGTVADVFLVFAEAFEGERRLGPTVFAVPRDAGVAVSPNPPKIGFRCLPTPDVVLRGVRVGDDAVIGEVGGGVPVLLDSLDYMRLGGGVVILGLARGALEEVGPWLDQREVHGGRRLGDTSYVQITLGRLLARLDAAEHLLWSAAEGLDMGHAVGDRLATVKLLAADLALEITQTTSQLWGWRGVREDHLATKRLRDARQTSVYEGTSEIQARNLYRRWAQQRRMEADNG